MKEGEYKDLLTGDVIVFPDFESSGWFSKGMEIERQRIEKLVLAKMSDNKRRHGALFIDFCDWEELLKEISHNKENV